MGSNVASRSWWKLPLGMDAGTGKIAAFLLTTKDVDDGSQGGSLLDQIPDPIASVTGDGAYDQAGLTSSVTARHPEAAIIVPPCTATQGGPEPRRAPRASNE